MGNLPPQKHPICWGVLKRNSEPLNTVQSRCGLGDEEGCVPIREKTEVLLERVTSALESWGQCTDAAGGVMATRKIRMSVPARTSKPMVQLFLTSLRM